MNLFKNSLIVFSNVEEDVKTSDEITEAIVAIPNAAHPKGLLKPNISNTRLPPNAKAFVAVFIAN